MDVELGFGKRTVAIGIKDSNVAAVLVPNAGGAPGEADAIVAAALSSPIGSRPLSEVVRKGERVVIVTSDITRPMPSAIVLPHVLRELEKAGIPDTDIEIVLGLGIHRRHTQEEKRRIVGDSVFERIKVWDSDPDRCVSLGVTAGNGTPIEVFEVVAKADRRICLGNIEYHYFAGYSGGGKAIMPGVCSRAAIQRNHSQMVRDGSAAGILDANPVRRDIDEAAGIVGVDFILNVILDEKKKIVHAVAGHYLEAHRAGAAYLDSLYKVNLDKPADIVLVSSGGFPKDINLYQAQKALDNAKGAVRDGGIIILVASCFEGLGEDVFERWMTGYSRSADMIEAIRNNFELGGHKAAAIAMILQRARIFLGSDLADEFVRSIFFEPYSDVGDALAAAYSLLGSESRVVVMPFGGSTLPCIEAKNS